MPGHVRVGLWGDVNSWVYPFLQIRRDITWVPLNHFLDGNDQEKRLEALSRLDYVLILSGEKNQVIEIDKVLGDTPAENLWQSAPNTATCILLRL
jgi:hypothetical protein